MKKFVIAVAILIAVQAVVALFLLQGSGDANDPATNNVSVVNGVQIIEIRAKGGYQPRRSTAKAGVRTVLRFNTQGTFDCSSSVRIPSLNISKNLPPSGSTDIDLGTPSVALLQGSCGMGMYPFEIYFEG